MNNYRNIVLWVIAGLFVITLFNLFQDSRDRNDGSALTYSEFLTAVDSNNVQEVVIRGNILTGRLQNGQTFSTYAPPQDFHLIEKLDLKKVKFSAGPNEENNPGLLGHLLGWAPVLIGIGLWIFFMKQIQSGNNKALGFGKSRARLLNEQKQKITFADVAGVEEAKQEVQEIIEFLKDPPKFQKLGGKIPKGVLLVGSPGTGKTLLARAIAGEANVPFFSISGSDFVEMFVGVGASRVRDLFEQGKKNAPCIIFIDEIDAVGRHRGMGMGGGNDEREQTLNQLLVEMDGFEANEGVILIAATNRPDVLDPALMRPGRFDRQVMVALPSVSGREEILNVHTARVPIGTDVDIKVIARGTPGFSGADLANLVNEAALLAARHNKRVVTQSDFESAKDKILMGPERRSMVMSEDEKKLTAYHEGGHAIIAHNMAASDPIHKATIIPRGRALGMVVRLPEGDRVSLSRIKIRADLAVALGGRVAEEIIFGEDKVTTGASSDIHFITDMARKMVTKWGLSALGPIEFGDSGSEGMYGGAAKNNYSEQTAQRVDEQVKAIIDEAYTEARQILTTHLDDLHRLAAALLEYETLTGEEITQLLTTQDFKKDVNPPVKNSKTRSTAPRNKVKKVHEDQPSE